MIVAAATVGDRRQPEVGVGVRPADVQGVNEPRFGFLGLPRGQGDVAPADEIDGEVPHARPRRKFAGTKGNGDVMNGEIAHQRRRRRGEQPVASRDSIEAAAGQITAGINDIDAHQKGSKTVPPGRTKKTKNSTAKTTSKSRTTGSFCQRTAAATEAR